VSFVFNYSITVMDTPVEYVQYKYNIEPKEWLTVLNGGSV